MGHMEEIILEYEVEDVRLCEHCHRLMDEGWLVGGMQTFCSDDCLKSSFPDVDVEELKAEAGKELDRMVQIP